MEDIHKHTILVYPYSSPYGELLLGSCGDRLCLCDWMIERRRKTIDKRLQNALHATYEEGRSDTIGRTVAELDEYFAGVRKYFDIPLLMTGTDFQKSVWQELLRIPYGVTLSYGELARQLGNPKAVRAVAAANGANPISLLIPCHRVIGSDRKLTGYGGGLDVKKKLLLLEDIRI